MFVRPLTNVSMLFSAPTGFSWPTTNTVAAIRILILGLVRKNEDVLLPRCRELSTTGQLPRDDAVVMLAPG